MYIDNSRVFMTSYCCTRTVHREREEGGREGEKPAQGNQQEAYVKPITYIHMVLFLGLCYLHPPTYKQQAPKPHLCILVLVLLPVAEEDADESQQDELYLVL